VDTDRGLCWKGGGGGLVLMRPPGYCIREADLGLNWDGAALAVLDFPEFPLLDNDLLRFSMKAQVVKEDPALRAMKIKK
jgi:hypothetical protein